MYCGREMRIGLDTAQHQLLWPEVVDRVQFAESAGFDGVWVFDHFKPLYGDPNGPCLEAWTLLAGLAAGGFATITILGARPVPGLDELTTTGFGFTVGGLLLVPIAATGGGILP